MALNPIKHALVSVYHKTGLEPIVQLLHQHGTVLYSTGGTLAFIQSLGIPVQSVESLTSYPEILGGRVKTLHPKVFGGILARREVAQDMEEVAAFDIPLFDLVMVDLYPFEATLASTNNESEIIEKIDIGGVSLIRAAAKNFKHTLIVAHPNTYPNLLQLLQSNNASISLEERKLFAAKAFQVTAHYDTTIFNYFNKTAGIETLQLSNQQATPLRYGENPHQKGTFFGNLNELFKKLHGKELSYNNLLDIDAALNLLADFNDKTVVIIKHNNPCGLASGSNLTDTWKRALAGDPISAFGGVIAMNDRVDEATAREMDKLFFEICIAKSFEPAALEILQTKKNRILLELKSDLPESQSIRSVLNGILVQEKDKKVISANMLELVTKAIGSTEEINDLLFADKISKGSKSNTIVLARNQQLLGIGCGMTSRIDALKNAIQKAGEAGFDLQGAVMASDAFFPFPDCVEIAHQAGIHAIIQPGGSIKDDASIAYCDANGLAMYFTHTRHFKH